MGYPGPSSTPAPLLFHGGLPLQAVLLSAPFAHLVRRHAVVATFVEQSTKTRTSINAECVPEVGTELTGVARARSWLRRRWTRRSARTRSGRPGTDAAVHALVKLRFGIPDRSTLVAYSYSSSSGLSPASRGQVPMHPDPAVVEKRAVYPTSVWTMAARRSAASILAQIFSGPTCSWN